MHLRSHSLRSIERKLFSICIHEFDIDKEYYSDMVGCSHNPTVRKLAKFANGLTAKKLKITARLKFFRYIADVCLVYYLSPPFDRVLA